MWFPAWINIFMIKCSVWILFMSLLQSLFLPLPDLFQCLSCTAMLTHLQESLLYFLSWYVCSFEVRLWMDARDLIWVFSFKTIPRRVETQWRCSGRCILEYFRMVWFASFLPVAEDQYHPHAEHCVCDLQATNLLWICQGQWVLLLVFVSDILGRFTHLYDFHNHTDADAVAGNTEIIIAVLGNLSCFVSLSWLFAVDWFDRDDASKRADT